MSSPVPDTTSLLRGIACADLRGAQPSLPEEPLDDAAFDWLLQSARASRLLGLLAVNIDAGLLPVRDHQADAAYQQAAASIHGDLRREQLLLGASRWLEEEGIEFRVLKGPAIAHLDERDPVQRSFGDIDLLLRGAQLPRAIEVLGREGFGRTFPEPRPGFDGRFSKGVCVRRASDELDLHRTLAPGPFGMRIPVDELWNRPSVFVIDGVEFEALPADLRLLHAAYHAILGGAAPRVAALRDLALLATAPDADVERVVETAHRWRGTIVLRRAVGAVEAAFGLDLAELRVGLPQQPDPRWQRRALRSYGAAPGRYARQATASLSAIDGLGDRIRYLRALVLPQRTYVTQRHGGRLARLGRGGRDVMGRRRR